MRFTRWMPAAFALALAASQGQAQPPLIVHEWGTLTTHHAPDGTPQGRLNRIDASDVLPDFVHRFEPPQTLSNPFGKGPRVSGRPDVTMRLETPVIYFYAPAATDADTRFDVRVQLRGGILNEFYPRAEPSVVHDMGRIEAKYSARVLGPNDPIRLDHYLLGTLAWSGVTFDARAIVPETASTRSNLRIAKSAPGAPLGEMRRFGADAYGTSRAAALRQSMREELVAAGLYDDEAEAMLATWNESYFRKPGLRLFYMVPGTWIDYFLPLELSVPHEATRVLVGRIDLLGESR